MNLEKTAEELATSHSALRRPAVTAAALFDLNRLSSSITRATRGFRTPRPDDRAYQKSAEWFLDNQHLIARTLRQLATEIPHGFRRRLPYVGDSRRPRALVLAEAFVTATRLDFDESHLISFVQAYQAEAALTIAELWALPVMLRVATIEELARAVDGLFLSNREAAPHGPEATPEPSFVVERSIRTLRMLSEMDWRVFVQKSSAVEAALREDPAGVYGQMDFESRDAYRRVVESVAWDTARPEPEVARAAIVLAADARAASKSDSPREGHVGYYLVDVGVEELKRRVGHRARGIERLRSAMLRHPNVTYFGSSLGLTSVLFAAALGLGLAILGPAAVALLCVLLVVPASSIAVAMTNSWVTRVLVPRPLPKLDFSAGIPQGCRSLVVIPTLVSSSKDFDRLLSQLERHYLSCPDPALSFALLTDTVDSPTLRDDTELMVHAAAALERLNARHAASGGPQFHIMHREARWNPAEGCFMGWERKRGKLEELNRFLRGDKSTSYKHVLGDEAGLENIRFVITLDADTQLPMADRARARRTGARIR